MTKLENGKVTKIQLCDDCANQLVGSGVGGPPFADLLESIPQILASLTSGNMAPEADGFGGAGQLTIKCKGCSSSFDDLRETGRVGCAECYEAFDERISSLIKRVHGAEVHTGKIPSRSGTHIAREKRVTELNDLLSRLVLSEEFERAAHVRDEIRSLQSKVAGNDE